MNERQTDRLVDWLFWLFETAFQFVLIRLPEKMREKREAIGEGKKQLNNHHPQEIQIKCNYS